MPAIGGSVHRQQTNRRHPVTDGCQVAEPVERTETEGLPALSIGHDGAQQ
jgi:hypothetical protein